MQISENMRVNIEKVIRERFGKKVDAVEMEMSIDDDDDDILLIHVHFRKDAKKNDSSGGFFGLTDIVRKEMDEQMQKQGIFPLISLMREHA